MRVTLIFLTLCLSIYGCAALPDTSLPPEIYYGEEVCVECGMIISDPRFAAAYYTPSGAVRSFDDIGGMCAYLSKHPEAAESYWVHDYETEEWLAAETAYFVISTDLQTPMDHQIVALSDLARAETVAGETAGDVLTFVEVLDIYAGGFDTDHAHDQ